MKNSMKKWSLYFSLMLVILTMASCKKGKNNLLTPISSGRPYEVLVVSEDKSWTSPDSALYHALDTDVPGLPQPERSFRISHVIPQHFDRVLRIFRNIIIVDIQDIYTQPKFKYTRNVYAAPQMIMTIQAPNQEEFAEYVQKNSQVIVDFFTRAEFNRQINLLKEKHNQEISAKVGSMFDCDIWMPNELSSYKVGKDFFWASSPMNDLNFVIYSYPYRDNRTFTKEFFCQKRDSVMKINIPGEREGMFMATDSMLVDVKNISVVGDYAFEARGLWEMTNDMMGGPFVSHARVDRANGRVVVVEGFVYKPEKLKRNLMRLLEAALYTLKLPTDPSESEIPVGSENVSEEVVSDSIDKK